MSNHLASVLTLSIDEINDHLTYISQQGLTQFVDHGDFTAYGQAVRYLTDELGQSINRVNHHLSWARTVERNQVEKGIDADDGFPPFTEPNLVQARVNLIATLALADQIRTLTFGLPKPVNPYAGYSA